MSNSSKFELFAVVESILGTGVHLALICLHQECYLDWNHDFLGEVLSEPLQCLKISLFDLKSKVFFKNKGSG